MKKAGIEHINVVNMSDFSFSFMDPTRIGQLEDFDVLAQISPDSPNLDCSNLPTVLQRDSKLVYLDPYELDILHSNHNHIPTTDINHHMHALNCYLNVTMIEKALGPKNKSELFKYKIKKRPNVEVQNESGLNELLYSFEINIFNVLGITERVSLFNTSLHKVNLNHPARYSQPFESF